MAIRFPAGAEVELVGGARCVIVKGLGADDYQIKLPSGELRAVKEAAFAEKPADREARLKAFSDASKVHPKPDAVQQPPATSTETKDAADGAGSPSEAGA